MCSVGDRLIPSSTLVPIRCSGPIRISDDGSNSEEEVRIRKRGTALSSPLADVFTEVVLFSMDRAVSRYAKGANLHRLHDDFWIWGPQDECVKAWRAVAEFNRVMGLEINEDKSGSVVIAQDKTASGAAAPHKKHTAGGNVPGAPSSEGALALPSGNIAWGFLVLDADTGLWRIDTTLIKKHIEELRL